MSKALGLVGLIRQTRRFSIKARETPDHLIRPLHLYLPKSHNQGPHKQVQMQRVKTRLREKTM
jgi:hypothetical protein